MRWQIMNNIYFDNVVQVGKLYLEHIFYELESEPILFSCVDERKNIYLCLCCEIRYGQRWIITKCGITRLKALIKEEIDIASAFLITPNIITIDRDSHGHESSCIIKNDKIDRLDLPKEGTYIRCDKEKAKNYLWNKEWEILCEQLKSTIDTASIIDEIEKSYSSVVNKTINILSKQMETYSNSGSKAFVEQLDGLSETLRQSMTIKYEYSLHAKEKYVEIVVSVDVDNAGNDDYLKAA